MMGSALSVVLIAATACWLRCCSSSRDARERRARLRDGDDEDPWDREDMWY